MSSKLTKLSVEDIDPKYRDQIAIQDYSKKPTIEGVQIVELKSFGAEDGYFMELGRIDENGHLSAFPEFNTRQISFSKVLPGGIKAWHLHFNQDDVWFVPPDSQLLVGLNDLRKDSPTRGTSMRLIMGNHKSLLLFIPRGVAHGCANVSNTESTMIYFTNLHFDINDPDERRLPWDFLGEDFWKSKKG